MRGDSSEYRHPDIRVFALSFSGLRTWGAIRVRFGQVFRQLPTGWPYGMELRNKHWLKPEYFACLARHGITHTFNSWSAMPSVGEQMAMPASRTNPERTAARFLLKPGRQYEDAVKAFQPYDSTKEINDDARKAGASLIEEGKQNPRRKTFIYINNRLEGNALATIAAMLDTFKGVLSHSGSVF